MTASLVCSHPSTATSPGGGGGGGGGGLGVHMLIWGYWTNKVWNIIGPPHKINSFLTW